MYNGILTFQISLEQIQILHDRVDWFIKPKFLDINKLINIFILLHFSWDYVVSGQLLTAEKFRLCKRIMHHDVTHSILRQEWDPI
jgi:hypothetical protein